MCTDDSASLVKVRVSRNTAGCLKILRLKWNFVLSIDFGKQKHDRVMLINCYVARSDWLVGGVVITALL